MANRISKLTKRSVEAIQPAATDMVYWDGDLTGFGIRVRASGRKTYVVQTRIRGKLRWFTLGRHGLVTADEARLQALDILSQAMRGIDPRETAKAESRDKASPTVAELARRFSEEYVPSHCKPSTQAHYRHMVERFIVPAFGNRQIAEIERKDIAEFHFRMRKTPYQANRALGVVSKMFNLAEVWGWRSDNTNPCRHVKPYEERKRERFLSEEETARLAEVLRRAEREMPSAVAAFRLLLLTGCRMSEIQTLRWEYVKEGRLELPDSKTGARTVPIGPDVQSVLASIPREPDNPWVIAGRFSGSHIGNLHRPWAIIRERAGLEDVRIHDLRHSFASRALALGESLPMIGKLLGHTQVQTTARYAHLAQEAVQSAATRVAGSIGDTLLDRNRSDDGSEEVGPATGR